MSRLGTTRGFTLMEVLVALAIFAIIGAASARVLRDAVSQSQSLGSREAALAALVRSLFIFEQDVQQWVQRPVRDRFGDPLPALALSAGELVLTRAGRRGEQGLAEDSPARGELQRVAWRLEKGVLTRRYWPVLDQLPETEPRDVSYGLELTALRCEILASDGQRYREWPLDPLRLASRADESLEPEARGLECAFESEIWGPNLNRFWRLPEGFPTLTDGNAATATPTPSRPVSAEPQAARRRR